MHSYIFLLLLLANLMFIDFCISQVGKWENTTNESVEPVCPRDVWTPPQTARGLSGSTDSFVTMFSFSAVHIYFSEYAYPRLISMSSWGFDSIGICFEMLRDGNWSLWRHAMTYEASNVMDTEHFWRHNNGAFMPNKQHKRSRAQLNGYPDNEYGPHA